MNDTVILEKEKTILSMGSDWKVIFLNDSITPMDYVVFVLTTIFSKSIEESIALTLAIHNSGSAVVATYSCYDIAEQKALEVNIINQQNSQALKVTVEE